MKISVIMPTYNDAESISSSIESVICQDYINWEMIVVDDGSTDNTAKIVNQYSKNYSINYYYQENSDQLNAIIKALNYVKGDYIFILHSDDLLPNDHFFSRCIEIMAGSEYDALIGDLVLINEQGSYLSREKINKYLISESIQAKLLIALGRNFYHDVAFFKTAAFLNQVKNNYLLWNTPFWLDLTGKTPKQLNIKCVEFPILKYRVHSANYINSHIGKLNVVNGNLRTVTRLMKHYDIPLYMIQFFILRVLKRLNIDSNYKPFYRKCEFRNKTAIIKNVVQYRVGHEYDENEYLNALINFYKHLNNTTNEIVIRDEISDEDIFLGKDIRLFNNKLLNATLPKVYYKLFDAMKTGFKCILVTQNNIGNVRLILDFLNIGPFVKIKLIKKEQDSR